MIMKTRSVRSQRRGEVYPEFYILALEQDVSFAQTLKYEVEKKLPVNVETVTNIADARALLQVNPDKFFFGTTSVEHLDSDSFEKIDLLAEFEIPAIVLVDQYQDELRDQLIKRHVVDYVVKDGRTDIAYIVNLIERMLKNTSIKVLVVDDSKVAQFVIARELALQKFEVLKAGSSAAALEILAQHRDIKLVLVDYQMKAVDGVSFVREARKNHAKDQLLIIGISTSTDERLAIKFLKAGANDFIVKPFNHEMVLCRINQNLDMLDAVELAKHLSNVDFLSSVYNRRYFFEYGERVLKDLKQDERLTVAMLDIDFFKKINDIYGHDVGDEVIRYIGAELKAHFEDDVVARLGGEEFAILSLRPQHFDHFVHVDSFRQRIAEKTFFIKGKEIQFSCSIGVSSTVDKTLDEVMVNADKQLYHAKESGRNCTKIEQSSETL